MLNRELRRTGGRVLITIGDQDIDLSPSFTIFLSTRDPTVRRKTSPGKNTGLRVPHVCITGNEFVHVGKSEVSCLPPSELYEPAVLAAAFLGNVTCSYCVTTHKGLNLNNFLTELQLKCFCALNRTLSCLFTIILF